MTQAGKTKQNGHALLQQSLTSIEQISSEFARIFAKDGDFPVQQRNVELVQQAHRPVLGVIDLLQACSKSLEASLLRSDNGDAEIRKLRKAVSKKKSSFEGAGAACKSALLFVVRK